MQFDVLWSSGAIAVTSGSFSETSLSHVLSNVSCQGSESNILLCQYSTLGSCGATEDAAVVCQGKYKISDVSRMSDFTVNHLCAYYSGSLLIKRCLNYTYFALYSYLNHKWEL